MHDSKQQPSAHTPDSHAKAGGAVQMSATP